MKLHILTVANKMPRWVDAAVEEYSQRLPEQFSMVFHELSLGKRNKQKSTQSSINEEGERLLARSQLLYKKRPARRVALEVNGKVRGTEQLAQHITLIRDQGLDLHLFIGGPDGLSSTCLDACDEHWSLSALTFAHPIVRILLAEQLYRVYTLLTAHPYHRG